MQTFLILMLVAVIIAAGLLFTAGIIRAAGNASQAEERWAQQDPNFREIVEAEQHRIAANDPDLWDFENDRPRNLS